jgi:hypothetical protein
MGCAGQGLVVASFCCMKRTACCSLTAAAAATVGLLLSPAAAAAAAAAVVPNQGFLRSLLPLMECHLPRVWTRVEGGLAEPVRPAISHGHPSRWMDGVNGNDLATAHRALQQYTFNIMCTYCLSGPCSKHTLNH